MALVNLTDLLKLYRVPKKTEDPAVESRAILKKVIQAAGAGFPVIRTRGALTHIIKPEKDGDFHFFVEPESFVEQPETPMMTCEIQNLNAPGAPADKIAKFKQLAGEEVELTGLLRIWPEHLRNSAQPHFFEIHPVLAIGLVGGTPVDFHSQVTFPKVGPDANEPVKPFGTVLNPPNGLTLKLSGQRIAFKTPTHAFNKENYVRLVGRCSAAPTPVASGLWLTLQDEGAQHRQLRCFVAAGSPVFTKAQAVKVGKRYHVGGLGGLDMMALTASSLTWQPIFSPALEILPA